MNGQKRQKYAADTLNSSMHTSGIDMGKCAKQTIYGCKVYDVALYKSGSC